MKFKVQSAPSQTKLFGGLIIAALLMFSQSVWAVGTASGTNVTNSATLSYNVGGVAQPNVVSDDPSVAGQQSTNFVVDNKVNLTVARQDAARVGAVNGQVALTPLPNPPAYLSFLVTNLGNTTQDFKLTTANPAVGATDPFTGVTTFVTSNCRVFLEANANTTLQIGTDTEVTATLYINDLAADGTQRVYLVCDTPAGATNGQTGVADLTAEAVDAAGTVGAQSGSYGAALTAANTQAGVQVVAADLAGTFAAGDIARDAKASDRDTYIIATAVLTVNKTITTLCDPFNGDTNPKNIPGAAVRYAITVANTGSASATLSQITDAINASLAFNTDLISGVGAGGNCIAGTGSLSASGFRAETGAGVGPGTIATAVATTAGATKAGAVGAETVTVNFPTLATSAIVAPAGATLAPTTFITVYFNAFVQ
jgi:uncharacterized repeat protein (TIGR01451 family)